MLTCFCIIGNSKNKKKKALTKTSTKVPSRANYLSFDVPYANIKALLLPKKLFPEKLDKKKT